MFDFGVKVTPLGARLCLLEDRGGRVLQNLLESGASWLSRWFMEVKKWEPVVVDEERVTWVRLFGLPCHVWSEKFFRFIFVPFGSFVRVDDITSKQVKMDVARFLIRTKCYSLINESLPVLIGGLVVKLRVVEDTQGPLRVSAANVCAEDIDSVSSG